MNESLNKTATGTAAGETRIPNSGIRSEPEGAASVVAGGTSTTGSAHAPADRQNPGRNARRRGPKPLLLTLGGAVAMTFAAYAGCRWWSHARTWTTTDNAYVSAHIHTVSPRVAGTVKEVLVEENQVVTAGAVLARLDRRDFEVRCSQARAQTSLARAQVQQSEAQVSQARAQVAREQARATKAKQDLARADSLFHDSSGAISKQELDQAQAESDAVQAGLQAAQAALESARAQALAASAQLQVADAGLQDANLQLSYTEILAPATGRIGRKNLETGNRVQPGQALLALVQPDTWVTANYKETQLRGMKPGQVVRVRLDAFPGRVLPGRVESLSPASGAEFALLPPDNATGNFTRIVQRVPVRIALDQGGVQGCDTRVVPGMSATVEVRVRE
jgi:membrane fusion protein, multidrug efflux system